MPQAVPLLFKLSFMLQAIRALQNLKEQEKKEYSLLLKQIQRIIQRRTISTTDIEQILSRSIFLLTNQKNCKQNNYSVNKIKSFESILNILLLTIKIRKSFFNENNQT